VPPMSRGTHIELAILEGVGSAIALGDPSVFLNISGVVLMIYAGYHLWMSRPWTHDE
jgi:hypothetical protein